MPSSGGRPRAFSLSHSLWQLWSPRGSRTHLWPHPTVFTAMLLRTQQGRRQLRGAKRLATLPGLRPRQEGTWAVRGVVATLQMRWDSVWAPSCMVVNSTPSPSLHAWVRVAITGLPERKARLLMLHPWAPRVPHCPGGQVSFTRDRSTNGGSDKPADSLEGAHPVWPHPRPCPGPDRPRGQREGGVTGEGHTGLGTSLSKPGCLWDREGSRLLRALCPAPSRRSSNTVER